MSDFNTLVQNVRDLDELCAVLNSFVQIEDHLPIDQCTDLCNLPTFSNNEPKNPAEVFSWDNERVLIDTSTNCGDDWTLVERSSFYRHGE